MPASTPRDEQPRTALSELEQGWAGSMVRGGVYDGSVDGCQ